jgi:hypothetical protein
VLYNERKRVLDEQFNVVHFVIQESSMSYQMQAGEVYRFYRSQRSPDMIALAPGSREAEVVAVDEETAGQMQHKGQLVYVDSNVVLVFKHPDDPDFILGQIATDPDVVLNPPLTAVTEEQMVEWGWEAEAICECGYYIRDHQVSVQEGETVLVCPEEVPS